MTGHGKVTTRRTSVMGECGAYDVYADGQKIGQVLTDVTRVWCAYNADRALVAAVARKRDAVEALIADQNGAAYFERVTQDRDLTEEDQDLVRDMLAKPEKDTP